MEIKENESMTTVELLKEAQRIQLECMIHRLPIHVCISMMPEFGQVNIYVNKVDHEVLWSCIVSEHPLLKGDIENIYNDFISVISEYTAEKQAG